MNPNADGGRVPARLGGRDTRPTSLLAPFMTWFEEN
jgi:hypothetical protein